MAPYTNVPLSPAELSFLRISLTQTPPIRPDGRTSSQFRPLVAETDILPSANGSARVCFADGTEAVVGVKAEVEKSKTDQETNEGYPALEHLDSNGDAEQDRRSIAGKGRNSWLEITIEVPGLRDDDSLPIFLSTMLSEALLADGHLKDRLYINARFHWRLYIDILLLSQPLSYPLPLLSLTTHLALLSTRIPSLVSERDEDPLFNDDWEASTNLYQHDRQLASIKPPITLLVMSVGDTILFDPSKDELAVADFIVAISATQAANGELKLISLRTIDPPSRLTAAGVPSILNATAGAGASSLSPQEALAFREADQGHTFWRPPRGGIRRGMVAQMIKLVLEKDGVGSEVLAGLGGVKT